MGLYLVEHHHTAEMCPKNNVEMVRQLSQHMTEENAARFGVKLQGDWVCEPEHTMFLILQAESEEKARDFVKPFFEVGTVTVKAGNTCQEIAEECLAQAVGS